MAGAELDDPSTSSTQTSLDASTWTSAPPSDETGRFRNPVQARYLRVNLTIASGANRTGIREVEAIKAPWGHAQEKRVGPT